jgi:hypothetical protein
LDHAVDERDTTHRKLDSLESELSAANRASCAISGVRRLITSSGAGWNFGAKTWAFGVWRREIGEEKGGWSAVAYETLKGRVMMGRVFAGWRDELNR